MTIQKQLEQWKRQHSRLLAVDNESSSHDGGENEDERWIKNLTFDSKQQSVHFQADLDFSEEFSTSVLIMTPQQLSSSSSQDLSVQPCDYKVVYLDVCKSVNAPSIDRVLSSVVEELEAKRMNFLDDVDDENDDVNQKYDDPMSHVSYDDDRKNEEEDERTDEDEELSETVIEGWMDDDDEIGIDDVDGGNNVLMKQIESDIEQVNSRKLGYFAFYKANKEEIRIYLLMEPRKHLAINDTVASAWGIDLDKYIVIAITFSSYYLSSAMIPQVDAFQSGDVDIKDVALLLEDRVPFGLYWTVQDSLKNQFFKQYWPIQTYQEKVQKNSGQNYMLYVLDLTRNIIEDSPGKCIICNSKLSYEGLKPTVCDSPLCVFSHEQYGLGINLETTIKKDPEIVDLLITLTYAAAVAPLSRFNPFNPFPSGLEAKTKDLRGNIVTLNFLNPINGERDNTKVAEVMNLIPPVNELSSWVDAGILKDKCDERHTLMYPLIRWILASNRCHLKKLKEEEQIQQMGTPHQYVLLSSTPSREREFQDLKGKYPSVYAFHGSPLGNWHAIMRNGLENMSGKTGQLHGAAYGSGVYLAPSSGTSFSYMKLNQTWKHSMFNSGSLGCMAMCEVLAKHPSLAGQPKPFYVVANEKLLATRYFFIYTTINHINVDGKRVKVPPVKL